MVYTIAVPLGTQPLGRDPSSLVRAVRLVVVPRVVLGEILLRPITTAGTPETEGRTQITPRKAGLSRSAVGAPRTCPRLSRDTLISIKNVLLTTVLVAMSGASLRDTLEPLSTPLPCSVTIPIDDILWLTVFPRLDAIHEVAPSSPIEFLVTDGECVVTLR